jgi:hypothetical protein
VVPDEGFSLLLNPGDATDRETVDVEFFVAQCHLASIPIAISIAFEEDRLEHSRAM